MVVPRFFWFSASVTLLVIAASAAYFLLAALPAAQRHRDELSAEIARKQADDKQIMDCAEQSRRTGDDMARHSGFGPPPNISGVSNHYNHKLSKCIADVQTVDKNDTAEFVMDAYEQSSILWCMTSFVPKGAPPLQRTCMDDQDHAIDPTEADKRIDALMHE